MSRNYGRDRTRTITVKTPTLGGLLPQVEVATSQRRGERLTAFVIDTAELAEAAAEDVLLLLTTTQDGPGVSLLENAIEGAVRTSNPRKIRALARVAAAALAGDDAEVQTSTMVLPAVLQLEPPHVRLMVELSSRSGGSGTIVVGTVRPTQLRGEDATIEAMLAQLNALGLASNQAGPTMIGPPQAAWYLTGFGHQVLRYLIDFDEHPGYQEAQ